MSSLAAPCSPIYPGADARSLPAVVLDTNAVLDWLVFGHPACAGWGQRLDRSQVRWLASDPMKAELRHVLGRGVGRERNADLGPVWQTWDRLATRVEPVALAGAATRVRCTDADDQKFIELALAHGACWLVSRDKALLKLARRVRPLGLDVLTPEGWNQAVSRG
jgi:predicted nucleic acid-binding protein